MKRVDVNRRLRRKGDTRLSYVAHHADDRDLVGSEQQALTEEGLLAGPEPPSQLLVDDDDKWLAGAVGPFEEAPFLEGNAERLEVVGADLVVLRQRSLVFTQRTPRAGDVTFLARSDCRQVAHRSH